MLTIKCERFNKVSTLFHCSRYLIKQLLRLVLFCAFRKSSNIPRAWMTLSRKPFGIPLVAHFVDRLTKLSDILSDQLKRHYIEACTTYYYAVHTVKDKAQV
jgi:hypothetical protein